MVKYEITVKNKPIEIQNIQIKNPPDKTEYMVGDSLNTKGLEVVGIDIYGTEVLLDKEQYTCSPTAGVVNDKNCNEYWTCDIL